MAQGDFTATEAEETLKALGELFEGIPKTKRPGYFGHLNDISLFIEAAKRQAKKLEDAAKASPPETTDKG